MSTTETIMPPVPSLAVDCPILLERLMETRLIIQASSGSGKSWALKRLIEQLFGKVQIIVIDPEGEFASLRERFDVLIFAPHGGDAAAHPKTAGVLAHRLLSAGVSAVLDIYDLKPHERIDFVRRFLESMVNAPREILRDVIIVLDEAHIFAPEGGKCESAQAVIDVATRGRKRGQCLIVATQRLSMLDKNVAAQMQNKLIGQNSIDVDVKRAAQEIGKSVKDTYLELRPLNPGEFLAFGPALSRDVKRIKIGSIATTHAKSGKRGIEPPPPPSEKMRKSLAKDFQDLPQEAEREAKTADDLRGEVRSLRAALTAAEKRATSGGISETEVSQRIKAAQIEAERIADNRIKSELGVIFAQVETAREVFEGGLRALPVYSKPKANPKADEKPIFTKELNPVRKKIFESVEIPMYQATGITPVPSENNSISIPQKRILDTLAKLETFGKAYWEKVTVAVFAGASPRSSSYTNNLGRLRTMGLIGYPSTGILALTDIGRSLVDVPNKKASDKDIHAHWYSAITNPQEAILRVLVDNYPSALHKEDIAARAGASTTSSSFTNNLGALRSLGAIEYPWTGYAKASQMLFPGLG